MKRIDTSDFREAYQRHVNAWDGLSRQLKSEPQSNADALLQGFLLGSMGDLDGGAGEMLAARNYWLNQVQGSWYDVLAVAKRHGAKIPNE